MENCRTEFSSLLGVALDALRREYTLSICEEEKETEPSDDYFKDI